MFTVNKKVFASFDAAIGFAVSLISNHLAQELDILCYGKRIYHINQYSSELKSAQIKLS